MFGTMKDMNKETEDGNNNYKIKTCMSRQEKAKHVVELVFRTDRCERYHLIFLNILTSATNKKTNQNITFILRI